MKERAYRLRVIRDIIQTNKVESQEALLEKLEKQGFSVTQATLSRDMKSLRIGKVSDGWNGYYYALPQEGADSERGFIQDVERGFLRIDFSGNIAVIQTRQGHADSVGYALDRLSLKEILGTLSGEDTVFLVMREGVSKDQLIETLRLRLPGLGL